MQHERDELVARRSVLARPEVLLLRLVHRRVVRENDDLLLGVERRDFQLGLVLHPMVHPPICTPTQNGDVQKSDDNSVQAK